MEYNPEHPAIKALHDQWHAVVAAILCKFGLTELVITEADVARLRARPGGTTVLTQDLPDGLHLNLVTEAEGWAALRKARGGKT